MEDVEGPSSANFYGVVMENKKHRIENARWEARYREHGAVIFVLGVSLGLIASFVFVWMQ